MGRVDNKQFLTEVGKLLTSANSSQSSLYLTQKRYIPYDEVTGKQELPQNSVSGSASVSENTPFQIIKDSENYAILFRITDGASDKSKKLKYSTVVTNDKLENFWKEYTNVLKSGITGLKKKEKKKNKKKGKGVTK
ncbi:RNA-binding signal recognition particle subunit [Saccharomycopsis crataegensis]|uniref:Signal recognition particle subunit SRP14 n=1 Tax=Saccharomycopsis crataegensis TaxID=43959 RepID=A0AAV5QFL5_9ASCO|nr:RNA-binding signal recognition particle subunit [Saccharomycopsis crataegensis]